MISNTDEEWVLFAANYNVFYAHNLNFVQSEFPNELIESERRR